MYKALDDIQSKLIKRAAGAYKATSRQAIERELEIQPITSYLTQLVVSAYNKEKEHGTDKVFTKICEIIRTSARAKRRKKLTPYQELDQWTKKEKLTHVPQRNETNGNQTIT